MNGSNSVSNLSSSANSIKLTATKSPASYPTPKSGQPHLYQSEWMSNQLAPPQTTQPGPHMAAPHPPHIDHFDPHRIPPYPPPPHPGPNINGNPVLPSTNYSHQATPQYGKMTPSGQFVPDYANGPHYAPPPPHGVPYGANYSAMPVPFGINKMEVKHESVLNSNEKPHDNLMYKHWEQSPDGIVHDAQQVSNHSGIPNRPPSAQEKHRTTPDRRTPGRSPGLGDQHNPHMKGPNGMPNMPPMPQAIQTGSYPAAHVYSQPPPNMYPMGAPPPPYIPPNNQPNMPFSGYPPDHKKMRLNEPESMDSNRVGLPVDSSFQVPSVTSSNSRHNYCNGSNSQAPASTTSHNPAQQSPMRLAPQMGEHWDPASPNMTSSGPSAQQSATIPASQSPNNSMTPSKGENGKVAKKKRKRCGNCPGCLRKDNCGECGPCKSVRSHQICKMRKCDQLKTKKEKVREVSTCSVDFHNHR